MKESVLPYPLVAIDIGNSRIKMASFQYQAYHFYTSKSLSQAFSQVPDIKKAPLIISTVRPFSPVEQALIPSQALILSQHTPIPLKMEYQTPHTLGTDRIAAACGAWQLFPNQGSLVVDLGTCINYELVTPDGIYKGGAISPGLNMRFKAMHNFTKKLPLVSPPFQHNDFPGKSTLESLEVGVISGIEAEIMHFFNHSTIHFNTSQCILTGGDAFNFEKILKNNIFAHPKLVLLGLIEILRHNI